MRKEISEIIKSWKEEAGVDGVILIGSYPDIQKTIKICVDKPSVMIGKGECLYNKYLDKLQSVCRYLNSIEFVETEKWFV